MLSQAVDFRAEADELYRLLQTLAEDDWNRPTLFKNWTINDVVQHLHVGDLMATASLAGPAVFAAFLADTQARLAQGLTKVQDARIQLGDLTGKRLGAQWYATMATLCDQLAAMPPETRLKWVGPDMGVRMFATARQMETWAHGQEIFDLLGVARAPTDRLRNIAEIGVRTFGWTFVNRGLPLPGAAPYVRLTSPSGAIWEWNEPAADNRVEGSALEFCQVVTQVRNLADTALAVTGAPAQAWMQIAQCFAGPPETPPAPGSRVPDKSGAMPITGRAFWYGADLDRSGDWVRVLNATHLAEIDAALQRLKQRGTALFAFSREEFPLPQTAALLADIADELENGRGAVRLRGLDPTRYSEDDLRQIFWGIGRHLGTAIYQNARGEIMGEVRDETKRATKTYDQTEEGRIASARARSRSTGPLRWHTDRCDVIALLCVSNAQVGGVSKLASIPAIHNEILRRRPDLLALLYQDYWRSRPADEDGISKGNVFAQPVFGIADGKITSQYSRTYVEQAQEVPGVPKLTAAQNEALDLLAQVAEEVCLQSAFVAGDIQLLNNHVIYHGRTAYLDDAAMDQERLLFRLWLATPNSRRLPDGFDTLWGSTAAGALRGGVIQPETGLRVPS